ncbi:hypothetical protein D3C73_757950 [compost metagenome]
MKRRFSRYDDVYFTEPKCQPRQVNATKVRQGCRRTGVIYPPLTIGDRNLLDEPPFRRLDFYLVIAGLGNDRFATLGENFPGQEPVAQNIGRRKITRHQVDLAIVGDRRGAILATFGRHVNDHFAVAILGRIHRAPLLRGVGSQEKVLRPDEVVRGPGNFTEYKFSFFLRPFGERLLDFFPEQSGRMGIIRIVNARELPLFDGNVDGPRFVNRSRRGQQIDLCRILGSSQGAVRANRDGEPITKLLLLLHPSAIVHTHRQGCCGLGDNCVLKTQFQWLEAVSENQVPDDHQCALRHDDVNRVRHRVLVLSRYILLRQHQIGHLPVISDLDIPAKGLRRQLELFHQIFHRPGNGIFITHGRALERNGCKPRCLNGCSVSEVEAGVHERLPGHSSIKTGLSLEREIARTF